MVLMATGLFSGSLWTAHELHAHRLEHWQYFVPFPWLDVSSTQAKNSSCGTVISMLLDRNMHRCCWHEYVAVAVLCVLSLLTCVCRPHAGVQFADILLPLCITGHVAVQYQRFKITLLPHLRNYSCGILNMHHKNINKHSTWHCKIS